MNQENLGTSLYPIQFGARQTSAPDLSVMEPNEFNSQLENLKPQNALYLHDLTIFKVLSEKVKEFTGKDATRAQDLLNAAEQWYSELKQRYNQPGMALDHSEAPTLIAYLSRKQNSQTKN